MPATATVLSDIDDVLNDWEGSDDAATWSAKSPGMPKLAASHIELAGVLMAYTGVDGYAAAVMTADISEWGDTSAFWQLADAATWAVEYLAPDCEAPQPARGMSPLALARLGPGRAFVAGPGGGWVDVGRTGPIDFTFASPMLAQQLAAILPSREQVEAAVRQVSIAVQAAADEVVTVYAALGRTVSLAFQRLFESPALRDLAHKIDVVERPRWHVRRCVRCNPACANTSPWGAAGHEYNRRRKARARRHRRRH